MKRHFHCKNNSPRRHWCCGCCACCGLSQPVVLLGFGIVFTTAWCKLRQLGFFLLLLLLYSCFFPPKCKFVMRHYCYPIVAKCGSICYSVTLSLRIYNIPMVPAIPVNMCEYGIWSLQCYQHFKCGAAP